MKEKILTCPFTGCQFTALEDADGNLYVKHPLTDDMNRVNYNCSIKKYNIPMQLFKHIETVTLVQAAEILEVTRQRMSMIAANNTIPAKTVNSQTVFILGDVLKYKETRKTGAPKKDVKPCEE